MKGLVLTASLVLFANIAAAFPTPGYPVPGPGNYVQCASDDNVFIYDYFQKTLWTLDWYILPPNFEPQLALEPVELFDAHNLRCPFCYDLLFNYYGVAAFAAIRTNGPNGPMTMTITDANTSQRYDVLNCTVAPLE